MGVLDHLESLVERRVETLALQRENAYEIGIGAPLVTAEIAGLEVVAGAVHFAKKLTGSGKNE